MKKGWILLHLLLLILIADQAAVLVYNRILPPTGTKAPGFIKPSAPAPASNPLQTENLVALKTPIIQRNLFKVLTRANTPNPVPTSHTQLPVKKTDLALTLWGTVEGQPPETSYAVIESKGTQALYMVGDEIQGATVEKIMRSQVILTRNGQTELLEVDPTRTIPGQSDSPPSVSSEPKTSSPKVSGTGRQLPLKRQARIRPYYRNGSPSGLLVYGIRKNSAFFKSGLRNGDIVKSVNGTATLTNSDVDKVYDTLSAASDRKLTILRFGKEKTLVYNAATDTFTEETP